MTNNGKVHHYLNINDVVLVTLTAHGNRIAEIAEAWEIKSVNDLGQTRWQIWRLMQVFGSHIYMGCENVFAENRLIWTV